MLVNRPLFYSKYKGNFSQNISQTQIDGYEAMFNYWDNSPLGDLAWLAYTCATAYHETGTRIEPVREGFCATDDCSIRAVTRLFDQGRIRRNYALPHSNGNSYFGRGLVQLTHGFNYEKMSIALGIGTQLYDNPSLALDLVTSVKILFKGMVDGLFTGRKLQEFFTDTTNSWYWSRQIINGLDKATLISGYGKKFYDCLEYAPNT